ncbi:MAG: polymer-forming cytoskeletal protein [candidate division Zixibacteria bacterium]|nr:polymer-forming cytoskeletal protein [candidate division Zixibacteria bacterium]
MAENLNTIIGKDSVFTGTIEVKGALRIDGKLKGKIISDETVQIGATGVVEADVVAKTVTVAGSVTGNIETSEMMELKDKGKIIGDVKTKSVVIEQGAVFHGSCSMQGLKAPVEKTDKFGEKRIPG